MTDNAAAAPLSRRTLREQRAETPGQTATVQEQRVAGAEETASLEATDLLEQLTSATDHTVETPAPTKKKRKPRRKASFTSVLGELLLTAGTLVLLFVIWQMWVGDLIIGAESDREAALVSEEWAALPPPEAPPAVVDGDEVWYEPPPVARPEGTEDFANVIVPRFGEDYNRQAAGGTTRALTLDRARYGLYDQSVMPGEVGNFSLAGHRTTYGAVLNKIDTLQLDDPIVIETRDGWYTYRFRTLEYVRPSEVDVLLEVPQVPGAETGERYITLTACSPKHSLAERIIAYGVFDSFQPRAEGEPEWLSGGDA